jgi:hypothetical protein
MTLNPVKVVSLRYRVLAAIGIPLLGMILIDPRNALSMSAITLIHYYPLGLSMVSEGWRILGISGYIVIGFFMLAALVVAKRIPFYVICGLLAITCSLTSYGCRNLGKSLEKTWGRPSLDTLHKVPPSDGHSRTVQGRKMATKDNAEQAAS